MEIFNLPSRRKMVNSINQKLREPYDDTEIREINSFLKIINNYFKTGLTQVEIEFNPQNYVLRNQISMQRLQRKISQILRKKKYVFEFQGSKLIVKI